ncbi:FkbM family methyltransferase [Mesorhizobium sp. L-8-10]|uniref:FkbM family methyltransferase n=1 Tax=Mesorhizobium sp. L-8-10 TaxID=2744523 RepID=UPI001926D8FC|nr:FkbM family methyltransferase [Mesorhizobium sp. L-8-10]
MTICESKTSSKMLRDDEGIFLRRIVFYPPLETQDQVNDLLARCGWYFHPYLGQTSEVVLLCRKNLITDSELPKEFDYEIEGRRQLLLTKVKAVSSELGHQMLRQLDPESDCLLVWDTSSELLRAKPVSETVARLRTRGRYYEVDPQKTRMEGSFYLWAGLNTFVDKAGLIAENRYKLSVFHEKYRNSAKAYVFGTGPTLSTFCETHDFSDGRCIIANSMVKNRKLLEQLRPVAIVAGDPIFHAGCSRYAGEFRRELLQAMASTDAFLFVPLRDYSVYISYLPAPMHERVVGVPFEANRPYTTDLSEDFYVSPLPNILTLLLLPLASTISREIAVIGCDGRPLDQDQYFWTHDKASQFNAEMDNIRHIHPGFFSIDYNDYYLSHCDNVKAAAEALEAAGGRVVSLTPSFVPALAERYVRSGEISPRQPDQRGSDASVAAIIAIDPDAMDHFGHFLSYDARIAEAAALRGLRFSIFGNVAFDLACLPESVAEFVPALSIKSWTLGNKPPAPSKEDTATFRAELERAISTLPALDEGKFAALYMYCGSLEHAEIIHELILPRQDLLANVNLFWSYAFDESDPAYVERWSPFLRKAEGNKRLTLTVPTSKLQAGFAKYFGVQLPVAPHPSTTFSDQEAADLAQHRPHRVADRPTVLFPGGMRKDKGFMLSVESALLLCETGQVDCTVRGLVTSGTTRQMKDQLSRLANSSVVVESREFDDRQFREFLLAGDVIVCPYLAPDFARRTSGLVVDAMLMGRPVVAVKDTWLGDLVEETGIGEASAPSSGEIFKAVRLVLSNYGHYAGNAAKARRRYLSEHSWERLVNTIVRTPSSQAAASRAYAREGHIRVDETEVVARMLRSRTGRSHIMLDVGAHFGTSASYFAALGWTIHCFEPDPSNRERLEKRFGRAVGVTIDSRAVSDRPAEGVSFFRSDESTGISGLHAFRDTHREAGTVDVTTITEVVEQHSVTHVDFLKIDVEGFDYSVLRGVPWDRLKPDVIECEFEDRKTIPLGHTYREVAQFLADMGYVVYLSEWHPIIRYGIPHDWYRLVKFPDVELAPDAWGNILAFKTDPGLEALSGAFEEVIHRKNPGSAANHTKPVSPRDGTAPASRSASPLHEESAAQTPSVTSASLEGKRAGQHDSKHINRPYVVPHVSNYERFVLWARRGHPTINRLGQFAMWTLRTARRHMAASIALATTFLALAAGGSFAPSAEIAAILWLSATMFAAGCLVVAAQGFMGYLSRREIDGMRARLGILEYQLRNFESRHRATETKLHAELVAQTAKLRTELTAQTAKLHKELTAQSAELASQTMALGTELSAQIKSVTHKSHVGTVEALDERLSQLKLKEAKAATPHDKSDSKSNINFFQLFNRSLSKEHLDTFLADWGKPLELELKQSRVGYLAHRACVLESQMKGRLATSIEAIVLRSLVASAVKRDDISILEIGTLFGIGAAAVYEAATNVSERVHLTVIDPLDGYYGPGKPDLLTGARVDETTLRQNWSLAGIPEKDYTIIKHFSTDPVHAIEAARKREYDVLIIDGDHSFDGVKFDFENYAPMVRPGGYILFDDYDVPEWPDIKRYVDNEIAGRAYLHHIGAAFRTAVFQVTDGNATEIDENAP